MARCLSDSGSRAVFARSGCRSEGDEKERRMEVSPPWLKLEDRFMSINGANGK